MSENQQHPRIRVAAIIQQNDSILLVRHQKGNDSYWLLPGGGVEFSESLESALVRELKEEACVEVQVGELKYVMDAISPENDRHLVQCCFTAEIISGTIVLGSDKRVVDIQFVSLEKIASLNIHPPMNQELIDGIHSGFDLLSCYLGNRWLNES